MNKTVEVRPKAQEPASETVLTGSEGYVRKAITPMMSYGLCALGALAAIVCVLLGSWLWMVFVAMVLGWDLVQLWTKKSKLGHRAIVRTTCAGAVGLAVATLVDHVHPWVAGISVAGLVLPIMFESLLGKAVTKGVRFIANLPGITTIDPKKGLGLWLVTASAVVIALGAVCAVLDIHTFVWLVFVLALDVAYFVIAFTSYRRIRHNSRTVKEVPEALAEYAPEFYIYTGRPDDASYQVLMWLPYLERTGRRFAIITRNNLPARLLAEHTDAPVLVCPRSADLEKALVPSLGAVFYVNASSGNGQMVRHQQYTHVYLGHGDSDKPPSYNPTHAMYDRIFAAGQAATERYAAHGVTMPQDKFDIVGRPQLEAVNRVTAPTSTSNPTVLYAPTWKGHVEETMLYSLPQGPDIVRALLERGTTVIFRPHPFSYEFDEDVEKINEIHSLLENDRNATGRAHLWGAAAETELSIIDCVNASDTMISDVSSVVSDYLYSGKPFAMTAIDTTGEDFRTDYPISRASYILHSDLHNLPAVLDELLETDTHRAQRETYRAYYLGDFAEQDYAQHFIDAANRAIDSASTQFDQVEDDIDDDADFAEAPAGDEPNDDDAAGRPLNPSTTEPEVDPGSDDDAEPDFSMWRTVRYYYRKVGGRTLMPSVASAVVFLAVLVDVPSLLTACLGVLGSLSFVYVNRGFFRTRARAASTLRSVNAARALLAASLLMYWSSVHTWSWTIALASAVLVLTISLEAGLAKSWRVTGLEARNVPGAETRGFQPIGRGQIPRLIAYVTAFGWVMAYFGALPGLVLAASLVVFGLTVFLITTGLSRGARSLRLNVRLPLLLDEYDAEFAVYFASNMGIDYQLGMWLPYLDRIGKKYIVVTRTIRTMRVAGRMTESPVIYRRTLRSLEDVITPNLAVAFYVNNAGKNSHFIERRELTHVWLNHGDSEKPACFNPVHAIYDHIFSAGEAGVDRYARHGVTIPREKFRIVGRPQVEQIEAALAPVSSIEAPTVLYAPTWKGAYKDSVLYSLPQGMTIVQALLDRGCTVIFRAHGLNYRYGESRRLMKEIRDLLAEDAERTGRLHVWGREAEKEMSLQECFNASDAMISDVSAVVTDFLQSHKPFSIVSVGRSAEELKEEAPASEASYVLHQDLSNLAEVLEKLLETDPLVQERESMRRYYLGDFPAETYAETFLETSRELIDRHEVVL